jgi:putative transposase
MARKLRVQYPGAIYHAMNRGDRRDPIFNDDNDRLLFLDTLKKACEKTDWQIHGKRHAEDLLDSALAEEA